MKIFRSKIGLELVVPVVIILLYVLFAVIKYANWFGLIMVLLVTLFFIYLAVSTTYKKIRGDTSGQDPKKAYKRPLE